MKKIIKPIALVLLAALIIIQFFKPERNLSSSETIAANDISKLYPVPQEVASILKTSCYDCHSNNTHYPWYSNFQPVAWWLADHVKEGKGELNFSEFASYRIGKQYRKLEKMNSEVKEGEMPLESYTFIHGDAKLNPAQKEKLMSWASEIRDSIKAHYPADSLQRPKRI
jgi:hypothetical protein